MDEREQSSDDKTEDASDERRRQYREQGNIANPRELVSAVALGCFTMLAAYSGTELFAACGVMFKRAWGGFDRRSVEAGNLSSIIFQVASPVLPVLVSGAAIVTLLPIVVGLVITQFNWSWKKLEFNMGKLNPLSGLVRMVSSTMLTELGKSIVKFLVFGGIIYLVISKELSQSMAQIMTPLPSVVGNIGQSMYRLLTSMALASFVLGVGDFALSWWKIEREMKMSKQQVKDEIKGQEGDPHVKGQRRRMARDIIMRRTLKEVPNATFIVTNPDHFAVAIRYVKGMSAPIVIAKGQDFLALKIKELAKKHDIITVENKPLARTLYKTVRVGQEVPPSLYTSIIEVMKYIYQLRGKDYFDRFNLAQATV